MLFFRSFCPRHFFALCLALCSLNLQAQTTTPLPIKVVVVAMFENGELSGDRPGEFQFWVERMPLKTELAFPMGPYPLRMNDAGTRQIPDRRSWSDPWSGRVHSSCVLFD